MALVYAWQGCTIGPFCLGRFAAARIIGTAPGRGRRPWRPARRGYGYGPTVNARRRMGYRPRLGRA